MPKEEQQQLQEIAKHHTKTEHLSLTNLQCNPRLSFRSAIPTPMVNTHTLKSRIEELGLTLDTLGKFVIVTQCSSQSEEYGLRYQDRIIKVQGINCVDRIPSDVVNYIRRWS